MRADPVFSRDEISAFLTHIGIDATHPLHNQRYCGDASEDLHLLQQLQSYFLSAVPFENLQQHYDRYHAMDIDPRVNFHRIVVEARGRGGYCMQGNIMYSHLLRGLGFDLYLSPIKIGAEPGTLIAALWKHMCMIVTLSDGTKYLVDVAYGNGSPTRPVELVVDQPQTVLAGGTQEMRLIKDHLPEQLNLTDEFKHWIYQVRNTTGEEWRTIYAFAEIEALETDLHVMNWYTSTAPDAKTTWLLYCFKYLRRPVDKDKPKGDQELYGMRALVDNTLIKESLGGKPVVVQEVRTDAERADAIERWFGIKLNDAERAAIRNWKTSLDQKPTSPEVWHIVRGPPGGPRSYEYQGTVS